MDARVLISVVIVSSCWCSYAGNLTANHFAGESALISDLRSQKNEDLCTLCKDFVSDAIKYLSEDDTLTEITSILHKTCEKIRAFKEKCKELVDFYAPLLLSEISSLKPKEFCRLVDLCKKEVSVSPNVSKYKCDFFQSEIVKLLVKACGSTGKNVKKCKSLVIQYTPIILMNAQKLLETNDLCTISHDYGSAPGTCTS